MHERKVKHDVLFFKRYYAYVKQKRKSAIRWYLFCFYDQVLKIFNEDLQTVKISRDFKEKSYVVRVNTV